MKYKKTIGESTRLYEKVPFFAAEEEATEEPEAGVKEASLEDEVEELVQAEIAKTKKISNLRNANGVEYAPWMGISAKDEEMIRSNMRAKAAARRARKEQETNVSGNLYLDSQAQELSGTGLNYKVRGTDVELEWATKTEKGTAGFVVKRRAAKTEDFEVIGKCLIYFNPVEVSANRIPFSTNFDFLARFYFKKESYTNYGPLVSKGAEGGVYRYLDDTTAPGGWVYRISEVDTNGVEADLCQCLVEIETEEEQKAAVIAAVGFGVLAAGALGAGLLLDPLNGSGSF